MQKGHGVHVWAPFCAPEGPAGVVPETETEEKREREREKKMNTLCARALSTASVFARVNNFFSQRRRAVTLKSKNRTKNVLN